MGRRPASEEGDSGSTGTQDLRGAGRLPERLLAREEGETWKSAERAGGEPGTA